MASIRDVAGRAGVAISTVSKVLNNYPGVSEETRRKVNGAIEELGFVPNMIASALSSKQVGRVALLVNLNTQTQAIDEIDMQYISGAINQAEKLSLDVITLFFSMFSGRKLEEIVAYLKAQSITGLIIYGIDKESRVLHRLIESEQFKAVVVDAPIVNGSTSSVWIDQEQAQYAVADKTVTENDCKSILYIAGRKNGYVTGERLKGIERLAAEKNLQLSVRWGEFREKRARELTFRYAKSKDCVVCASDLMAIGAMKALIEMDIFRPVCGFDGIMLMGYVGKQMNTVKQDFYRVSAEAMKEVNRLLQGNKGRNLVLDYELVRLQYQDIIY